MNGDLRARIRAAISSQATTRELAGRRRIEIACVNLDAATDAVLAALKGELTALPDGRLARPERDRLELALIRERRDAGQTWREIAEAAGANSPQVVHARFQRLVSREAEQRRREAADPKCSECGGRPKRGLIKSEDGETWQCEGCYHDDLASGPIPEAGGGL